MKKLANQLSKGSVLVLLRDTMPEIRQFFQHCRQIAEDGWSIVFLTSSDVRSYCEQAYSAELTHQSFHFVELDSFSQILASIIDFRAIVLPVLTFGLSGEILALNDQDPFVRCMIQGLLRNQRVIAITTAMQPLGSALENQPNILEAETQRYFERLQQMKIELVSLENLLQLLSEEKRSFKQKLITEEDILALQDSETDLRVGKETIITPLALDRANERNIKIIRE